MEEKDIIKKLKEFGKEMSKQDVRATANPLWTERNRKLGFEYCHAFSFFETDVEHNENNFVVSNYDAPKMIELQELLLQLSKL